MNPEYERNVISITDEEGVDYELEVLAVVEYNGAEYLALTELDADEEAEELEVSILKSLSEDDEEPVLVAVEDEAELEAVYDLLMEQMFDIDVSGEDEELPEEPLGFQAFYNEPASLEELKESGLPELRDLALETDPDEDDTL